MIKDLIDKTVLGFSDRVVIDLGNGRVAKIPLSDFALECNIAEYNNFNNLKEEDKKYVATVYGLENGIVYQEKLDNTIILKWNISDSEVNEFLKHIATKENIDSLNKVRLKNRLQIGSHLNLYKIFDFEETIRDKSKYHRNVKSIKFTVELWEFYLSVLIKKGLKFTDLFFVDWYYELVH